MANETIFAKDASLVHQAFMQSNLCLKDMQIFHSDRGIGKVTNSHM